MVTLKQVGVVLAVFMAQAFLPPLGTLIVMSAWAGKSPNFLWILAVSLCSLSASLPLLYGRSNGVPAMMFVVATALAISFRLANAPLPGYGEIVFLCVVAGLGILGYLARRSPHLETFLVEARLRRTVADSSKRSGLNDPSRK